MPGRFAPDFQAREDLVFQRLDARRPVWRVRAWHEEPREAHAQRLVQSSYGNHPRWRTTRSVVFWVSKMQGIRSTTSGRPPLRLKYCFPRLLSLRRPSAPSKVRMGRQPSPLACVT